MIEYLYNAIRVLAGTEANIATKITDIEGNLITSGNCAFMLHEDSGADVIAFKGSCIEGIWNFTLPAEFTAQLKGKYWYCVKHNNEALCFKNPIYFV